MTEPTYKPSPAAETLVGLFTGIADDAKELTVPRLVLWEVLVEHAQMQATILRQQDVVLAHKVAATEANMRAAARFAVMLPSEQATEALIDAALDQMWVSTGNRADMLTVLVDFTSDILRTVHLVKSRSHGGDADWVAADGVRLVPAPPDTSASSGPKTLDELGGDPV